MGLLQGPSQTLIWPIAQDAGRDVHQLPLRAKGWTGARRVVAKVEWHQGDLWPRVGFIVTKPDPTNRRALPGPSPSSRAARAEAASIRSV